MNTYTAAILESLDEPLRSLASKVLSDCTAPPNGEPPFDETELNQAAYEIAKAVRDCATLDAWHGSDFFSGRFRASLEDPRSYAGLAWKIMAEPDGKKAKPLAEALAKGPDHYQAAKAIHDLKESVRDGMTLSDAILSISERLPLIAASDPALEFFKKSLPGALIDITNKPERYTRGLKGWIERAWIPLALWLDIHEPQKVHDTLQKARDCYPPAQGMRFNYQPDFLQAWSKLKPTRRRKSSRLPMGN